MSVPVNSVINGDCLDVKMCIRDRPSIEKNPAAQRIYRGIMKAIQSGLKMLEQLGVPREDTALGLPLGMETKIVCKHNLRNLIDMSHQRMCSRAYHEYRRLFNDVCAALREYSDEWAYLVDHYFMPKCDYFGFCREKKSCGKRGRRSAE